MSDFNPILSDADDEAGAKKARVSQKRQRAEEITDLKAVLELPQGRRVLTRLIQHCHVFRSIWRASAEIHKYAGHQEVGQFLLEEIKAADPKVAGEIAAQCIPVRNGES